MTNRIWLAAGIAAVCGGVWLFAITQRDYSNHDTPDTELTASKAENARQRDGASTPATELEPKEFSHAERFTYESSQDFSMLKLQYEAAAEAGDPFARRVIANIYGYCAGYSLSAEKFAQRIETMKTIRPESSDQLDVVRSDVERRCSKLDGGAPIPYELIQLTRAEAVAARDPVYTLQVATLQADLDAARMDQLIGRLLPSADPDTLFEIGTLIGAKPISEKYSDFSDSYLGQYAWQIAACRRGGELTCGARSPRMTMMCLNGICTGMGFEQSVMASLPAADHQRLRQLVSKLETFLSGDRK